MWAGPNPSFASAGAQQGGSLAAAEILRKGEALLRQGEELQRDAKRKLEEEQRREDRETKRRLEEEAELQKQEALAIAEAVRRELTALVERLEIEATALKEKAQPLQPNAVVNVPAGEDEGALRAATLACLEHETPAMEALAAFEAAFMERQTQLRWPTEDSRAAATDLQARVAKAKAVIESELKRVKGCREIFEANAAAGALQAELTTMLGDAASAASTARQLAAPLVDSLPKAVGPDSKGDSGSSIVDQLGDDDTILETANTFSEFGEMAVAAIKTCMVFLTNNSLQLKSRSEAMRKQHTALITKSHAQKRDIDSLVARVKDRRAKALAFKEKKEREIAAKLAVERQKEIFKASDKDGDEMLSADEVREYVAEEFKFEISQERLENIIRKTVSKGAVGVTWSQFPQLRLLVGMAHSEHLAKLKKIEQEEAFKRGLKQIEAVKKNVAEVMACLSGIETEVSKAEKRAKPLYGAAMSRSNMNMDTILERADEVDSAAEAARDFIEAAREQAQNVAEGTGLGTLEPQAQNAQNLEVKRVEQQLAKLQVRLSRAEATAKACRERVELQKKKAELLRNLELPME